MNDKIQYEYNELTRYKRKTFLYYENINSSEKRLFHEQCTNFSYPPQHLSFTETGVTVLSDA